MILEELLKIGGEKRQNTTLKTLLVLLILSSFLLINSSYAIAVYSDVRLHGYNGTMANNIGAITPCVGEAFTLNETRHAINFTAPTGGTATKAMLYINTSTPVNIMNVTLVGRVANFEYNLTNNTQYMVMFGNDCSVSSYTDVRYNVGNPGYPYSSNGATFLYSVNKQANTYSTDKNMWGGFQNFTSAINGSVIIPPENKIILKSQNPANITATTLFSQIVNVTYTFNNTNLSNPKINYTIYHNNTCINYLNGTCIQFNNTYQQKSWSNNVTSGDLSNFSFTFGENDIYPGVRNLNDSYFNIAHSNYDLANDNRYLSMAFINISLNERYNILEVMALSSNNLSKVYACNQSYNYASAILSNVNCMEIGILKNSYNHSHTAFSSHQNIPFTIINGKINGIGITATSNMTFIIRGANAGTTNVSYVNNQSRPVMTKSSTNGNVWTSEAFEADSHIHQYNGDTYFKYQGIGTYDGVSYNSSFETELIDVPSLSPSPPLITVPFNTNQSTRYMNITYMNSTPFFGSIIFYNITLLNSDFSFNRIIKSNNSLNNNYSWDVYSENLTIGVYYIQVEAKQNDGLTNFDYQSFNLTRNAELNSSVKYVYGGNVPNYTINLTWNGGFESINIIDSLNTSIINIIKNTSYYALIDAPGYAIYNENFTTNATSNIQYKNFSIYTTNSVLVNIFDETSLALITQNMTVVFSGATENTFTTATGSLFVDNLTDGTWTVKLSNSNYSLKTYVVTVQNRSFQTLNTYMSLTTSTTIFSIGDSNTLLSLENVNVNVEKIINGTYTTVTSLLSDITGRVQITYTPLTSYRFTLSKTGYTSKVFILNPVLFSDYTIYLDPVQEQSITSGQSGLSITYYPKVFTNNANNQFTIVFTSPGGIFTNYNVTLTYPGGSNSTSGVNAYGESFTLGVKIINASLRDYVNLTYSTNTTISGSRTYTTQLEITNVTTGAYTIMQVKNKEYGLGLFEKAFIVMIATAIIAGFGYMLMGYGGALFLGLFVEGIAVYLGLLPLWSFLITILVGFILLIRFGGI